MALNLDTADAVTPHVLATLRDDTEEDLVGSAGGAAPAAQ
jgi:hypothetical protein